jgi:hypothetical protein
MARAGGSGNRQELGRTTADAPRQPQGPQFTEELHRDQPGMAQVEPGAHLPKRLAQQVPKAIPAPGAAQGEVGIADAVVGPLSLSRDTRLGEAVHFFFYDTPKVLLLLAGIVFVMGVVQTFFAPERTRALTLWSVVLFDRGGMLEAFLAGLRERMRALGSRRVPFKGGAFWDYKPDFRPGDVVEL